ncbi:MAG: zinc-binding dehydrogenase [Lentisphaeria bacterium]|nr:2-enoyl thioester reductase domain-containing protein [Lentisphaeria bacterium]NQZ69464.1 zinc-binding dehydrogenase [Lentisphaeria bacterium]
MRYISLFNHSDDLCDGICLSETSIPKPASNEIHVRTLASPINPADINVIEGTYPILPSLPAVPGNEGVAEVIDPGDQNEIQKGDIVIAANVPGWWSEHRIIPADKVYRLPPSIDHFQAACLSVNPATAWRLIHDFVQLKPGDWIVINAANSALGQSLNQIARALDLKVVNLARRPSLVHGSDTVFDDDDSAIQQAKSCLNGASIKLAINQVGGQSSRRLMKLLSPNGTMVTVGAMSKEPITVSGGQLIFKNLILCGFWITKWLDNAPRIDIEKMYDSLADLMIKKELEISIDSSYPLEDYQSAIQHAKRSRKGKVILTF